MRPEGELVVTLHCTDGHVRRATVRSSRPRFARSLLRGRTPAEAVDLVARVHGVCAHAQAATAALALEQAVAGPEGVAADARRAAMVRVEAIQEHVTRLGLDWASAMGDAPLVDAVRALRAVTGETLARLPHDVAADGAADAACASIVPAAFLGMAPAQWLDLASTAALDAWSGDARVAPARWFGRLVQARRDLGATPTRLMPAASAAGLATSVVAKLRSDEHFATAPTWDGAPVESGSLARMGGHPLVADALGRFGPTVATRLVARLTELAALLLDVTPGDDLAGFGAPDEGCAWAQTARGVLLHRAVVDDGRVADYAILAPTEWNFHPAGRFVEALGTIPAGADATIVADATLLAHAFDPCVACRIEVAHA